MTPLRSVSVAATIAALAQAPAARADASTDPSGDAWWAAGITAAALVADGLLASVRTAECRICVPDRVDADARRALLWRDPAAAQRDSDVLANGAIPLLALGDAFRSRRGLGDVGRDALVVAEAASLSDLATEIAKDAFARRRPGLPSTGPASSAGNHSLWSGHTSFAFSVAVAQAMQDSMRGDEAAPWVWAVGLTLAGTVGYLRVAGDAHWLTDVLAGAAAGSAFGVVVPLAERRLVGGVTVAVAPGGFVVRF
jgi:membrane-associated phospholipid phosphatase